MKLKKVKTLRYDAYIEELDKTIHFRSFKHGEQKLLLIALELKDQNAIVNAILDIVTACTFGELDVSKIPMHLVDLIFLKIYIASVGDKSPALFTCATKVDGVDEDGKKTGEKVPCGFEATVALDLDKAGLVYPEDFEKETTIEIDDETSIKLKIPSFETFKKLNFEGTAIEMSDQFIFAGLEAIIQGDEMMIPSVDFTPEELKEWIDDLDSVIIEKISSFFGNVPELVLVQPVTCPKCGGKEVFHLKGLDAFFG